jgi:dipeptidyl aminopeptidase/acylaminoacyl peptidase
VHVRRVLIALVGLAALGTFAPLASGQFVDETIHATGVPPIPPGLPETIELYRYSGSATLQGWMSGLRRIVFLAGGGEFVQAFAAVNSGERFSQLTFSQRPVIAAFPHPKRERFVVATDDRGDENFRLDLYDIPTSDVRRFTSARTQNQSPLWSRTGRLMVFTSNSRNGKDRDLYLANPPGAGRRLLTANGACFAEDWSPDDSKVVAVEWLPDAKTCRVHLIDVNTRHVETLPAPPGAPVNRKAVRWVGNRTLYWITDRDSEFLHLARYDIPTGREISLTAKISWDVEDYDISSDGKLIVFTANENGFSRLHVLERDTGNERHPALFPDGSYSRLAFRPNSLEFAFEWGSSKAPSGLYSYDLKSRVWADWVKPRPVSPNAYAVSDHVPFRYKSFDGRMIPAFIRKPGPEFAGPRPVLIVLHGGPAAQYRPKYSVLESVLLGELGIALVMPNVRGSTGYGRSFEMLDNGPLREDAIKDVGALLDWIGTRPDLDSSRIAVSGGSHGGYMALAALARYGDRIQAAIDVAGFSHFESSMKDERPATIDYWRREFGDERDPETLEFFRSISPLAKANQIKKPLLVVHGQNDPRVKVTEADRIVAAVRASGTPVWYVRFDGEGHGFQSREHNNYLTEVEVLFLERFLAGEAEDRENLAAKTVGITLTDDVQSKSPGGAGLANPPARSTTAVP